MVCHRTLLIPRACVMRLMKSKNRRYWTCLGRNSSSRPSPIYGGWHHDRCYWPERYLAWFQVDRLPNNIGTRWFRVTKRSNQWRAGYLPCERSNPNSPISENRPRCDAPRSHLKECMGFRWWSWLRLYGASSPLRRPRTRIWSDLDIGQ